MKNFETIAAQILLKKIQVLNFKQENSTSKEMSDYYLTQLAILYKVASELYSIDNNSWYHIEKELEIIANN